MRKLRITNCGERIKNLKNKTLFFHQTTLVAGAQAQSTIYN